MRKTSYLLSLIAIGCMVILNAAPASIGVVRSPAEFRIDGSPVRGNSTIFEGNTIETSKARSEIQLADGARVTLTPDSRAKVYRDHTVLEQGQGILRNAAKGQINAGIVRISPATKYTVVQVAMNTHQVAVSVTSGSAEVRNASGLLVSRVVPGQALAFEPEPQGGAATPVRVCGTLEMRNGMYYVTDTTTRVTVQLMGQNLASFVGKKVSVTGSLVPGATPTGGATEVANVTSISASNCGGGGGAAAGGISAGAKAAIIGGVVAGGILIGLAASGTFSSETTSP